MTDAPATPSNGVAVPPVKVDYDPSTPLAMRAMARGDVHGFLDAALTGGTGPGSVARACRTSAPEAYDIMTRMVRHMLALRDQNVVALGQDDAFALRGANGNIERVTVRVPVSFAAGHLYTVKGNTKLTLVGLRALNRIAGLHVGLTPTVCVGGEERSNPYVQRSPSSSSGLGDVLRVVVSAVAVGRTQTGAVVAVRYVLEYEPMHELRAMLLKLVSAAENVSAPVHLVASECAEEERARLGSHWKAYPAFGGLVLLANLRSSEVLKKLTEYHTMLSQAERRAQSFAVRNAMSAHPALSFGTIQPNDAGVAHIPVTGWRGEVPSAMATLVERTGNMEALAEAAEVRVVDDPIDMDDLAAAPDPDALEEDEAQDAAAASQSAPAHPGGSPETMRRNALIQEIDGLLAEMTPARATKAREATAYNPADMNADALATVRDRIIAANNARTQKPPEAAK